MKKCCLAVLALIWALPAMPAAGESSRLLVGHAMAMLAVFEQAGTLPPEAIDRGVICQRPGLGGNGREGAGDQ